MKHKRIALITFFALFAAAGSAQESTQQKAFEIYGFIMMDAGYNANQIHPDWFDVVRPTKLPSSEGQYGTDGNAYFSVRQTRLGFKGYIPTALGELKTIFEFELFGTGVDAGQTTMRLRHAYAELGKFGVGQYWSPFMDIDVFPNTVEYWGPTGMVFFRNIQVRYMPIQGDTRLTFALERPGASADQGDYSGRIELEDINSHFPVPDFSAEYRHAFGFGYIELAGILRYMAWEDMNEDEYDLSGNAVGWGLNLSSNVSFTKSTVGRFQAVYGQGIQNYMNDAPVDVGVTNDLSNPAVTLPVLGIVAFVDQKWNDKFTSSVGYSMIDITNSEGMSDDAFSRGHYAIANLLYYPAQNAMMGVELQYGTRENFNDDWKTDILKVQFSFKYNFSHAWYR
ncbi:MAG: DcaP family trimeric outer membrane transporter [Bacteroidales bacterium]|jgi:hypothetical protein|nr:DcaP family trimeric outer membrane transporter [Bacteroidales bacterium]